MVKVSSWCDGSLVDPLLLIGKNSLSSGGSGFPFSKFESSFTICLMPFNHK